MPSWPPASSISCATRPCRPRESRTCSRRSPRSPRAISWQIPTLGHAGDGNLHPIILFAGDDPAQQAAADAAHEELTAAALALGGTITGEHGIGSEKRHQMAHRFRPAEIAAMRAVKAAFDPAGLLNPGMVLPEPTAEEPSLPRFAALYARSSRTGGTGRRWSPSSPGAQTPPVEVPAIMVDADNRTVTVAAATPLGAVHAELARYSLETSLPNVPDTVGAVVTSDDAARGVVRNTLLAVHATLPDGSPVRFGGSTVKDVAGYDLKRLFTGSGNRFGTLHEVTLQVRARRHETARAPGGGPA